jgi:hypothetical protein
MDMPKLSFKILVACVSPHSAQAVDLLLLLLLFFFCTQKRQPTSDNSFRDCNNQVMQLSTDHRDGVCIAAAAATCQFLQVFYLHQPQALKKFRNNDAVAAPATMVCHLLE